MSFAPDIPAVAMANPSVAPIVDVVPPPVALPTDWEKPEKILAGWLRSIVENQKTGMANLHARCNAALNVTQKSKAISDSYRQAESLDYVIHTREAADQRDDMTGLMADGVIRNGRLSKVVPGDPERVERAMVVDSALDWELTQSGSKGEAKDFLRCYATYPYAGLKSVKQYKDGYICHGVESINPHCFMVSDIGRKGTEQFAVTQLWFYTKREMRQAGFRNLDKLKTPDGHGENKISPGGSTNSQVEVEGQGTFKVWETWVAPPLMDWTDGKTFTPNQLLAWIYRWELPPNYFASQAEDGRWYMFDSNNLLRFYHHDGVILKVTPNYLVTPSQFPHHTSSFHPPTDKSFAGESFIERSSDSYVAQHALVNAWYRNMQMVGNQSMFVSARSSVPLEEFEKIYKPRGVVVFSGNEPPDQLFVPFKPVNIAQDLMPGIQFFQSKIEQNGVNDVMRGVSRARTATANANDNARGQMQINEAIDQAVSDAVHPCLKDLTRMIVADYTDEDWYRVTGESGAQMINSMPMTEAEIIDKHFKVLPVASSEFLNEGAKVMELNNILAVAAQFLPPDMSARFVKVMLDHTRLDRMEIEYIEGNKGSYTDIMQEIEAMKKNPFIDLEVLPTDDHIFAMQAVDMVTFGNPETGEPPIPDFMQYPAVQRYYKMHQLAQQALEQQQMMAMMGAGGALEEGGGPQMPGQPKGNAKQIPREGIPTDPLARVRSEAQIGAPPQMKEAPGQTGRAVRAA